MRESARKALQMGPQEDPQSQAEAGCDWCGGILIAWTSPPEVREVKPEVQQHFPRPLEPGDILASVDGEDVSNLKREEVLTLMAKSKEGLGFKDDPFCKSLRHSAQKALQMGPQEDPQSQAEAGCDWCGGILIAWTSPPEVREVEPEVQQHYPRPVEPGDMLSSVDGTDVHKLQREEVLTLMAKSKQGLGFAHADPLGKSLRLSAQKALQMGPQEDPQSQAGCDWCAGILIAWTSPPEVRAVIPEVQQHLPRPIAPGDHLVMVDGTDVRNLQRDDILMRFASFEGSVSFRGRDRDHIEAVAWLKTVLQVGSLRACCFLRCLN